MEEIEVHSRDYLLRWVHAKSNSTISWTIQPHKRSVNFGLFKHPGALASLPSVAGLPALSNTISRTTDDDDDEPVSELVHKLGNIGLKQVVKLNKYDPDRFSQGRYEVPSGEGGHYALVFDNTFSKSTAKSVTFFLMTYPTSARHQISFGAQVHHSQTMASAMSLAPAATTSRSPKFSHKDKQSIDSLKMNAESQSQLLTPRAAISDSALIHTGVLLKRRRKKHQGYAKRFFCLDYISSTLSYYHDRNSSALRGAIPLSLAAIGANAKTREISIDSGAEIWHLKANSPSDFNGWKAALEKASQYLLTNASTNLDFDSVTSHDDEIEDDRRWQRAEALLSRISGTRDAVRRLLLNTQPSSNLSHSPSATGNSPTMNENGGDDYFGDNPRRAFWKRKSSNPGLNSFKRSTSTQLAPPSSSMPQSNREFTTHDHIQAIQDNLDAVIVEFTGLMQDWKRRSVLPESAISRMSMESQEYFDAEDARTLSRSDTQLLDIAGEDSELDEGNSGTDSEVEETVNTGRSRAGSLSSFVPPKAKSLIPLPTETIPRRITVNPPTVMPPSLIGFLRKNVGKDLSTISMPVSANEPTSLLQKAAENLEYSELLDKAARLGSIEERLAYITAFVISSFSNTRVKERSIRKPFNPMLGETYELVREDKFFRFVAEKVSHRPVQLAFHAEAKEWSFAQSPKPSQKFWGKSSEIITEGKARVVLYHVGESYSWNAANCFLRNIIAGEKYIEPVGSMDVVCNTTGHRSTITFKAKGMFSGRSEEVDVKFYGPTGEELDTSITGTWTKSLTAKSGIELWKVGPLVDKPEKHYGMTLFAASLNEITLLENGKLPPTDSRLRPDQRALEDGKYDEAERLKNDIEEGQRKRRREMEEEGVEWVPKFFVKVVDGDESAWKLKRGETGYWERRARGDWSGIVDVLSTV